MALGFTPVVQIYGANADLLNQRLISWEHIDAAGIESDQLTLTIDLEGLEGLPNLGGKIGLLVGYLEMEEMVDKGQFKVTRLTPTLFPFRLTLVATAAPFTRMMKPASSSAAPPVMDRRRSVNCLANWCRSTVFHRVSLRTCR